MARLELDPAQIPTKVREVCSVLHQHGEKAWIVGGCLRDLLLGRAVSDWDLATTARPERVVSLFRRTIPTGIKHGTVTVLWKGEAFEVTTLRGEGAYTDGRRPDHVFYVDRIEDDLGRRDFTVNAIAFDPVDGSIADPFGGLEDLHARVLRAVGDPIARFSEDGLRILRGARFAATLGFELDPATEAAFRPTLDVFRKVSAERVREEWMKAMKAERPSRAFVVMRRTGILDVTFPELAGLPEGVAGSGFALALEACDRAAREPIARHAALLAPLGRPADAPKEALIEAAGSAADRIDRFLRTYRYSNEERGAVVHVVRHQHPHYRPDWSDADVRRYVQRVGLAHLDLLLATLEALDAAGGSVPHRAELAARIAEQRATGLAVTTKDLAVSGQELMAALGIRPGPGIGRLQRRLLDHVTETPMDNVRERLLAVAAGLVESGVLEEGGP
ncbi:MAG: hypothetical protein U0230_07560 [Polyangiales bacterium]